MRTHLKTDAKDSLTRIETGTENALSLGVLSECHEIFGSHGESWRRLGLKKPTTRII